MKSIFAGIVLCFCIVNVTNCQDVQFCENTSNGIPSSFCIVNDSGCAFAFDRCVVVINKAGLPNYKMLFPKSVYHFDLDSIGNGAALTKDSLYKIVGFSVKAAVPLPKLLRSAFVRCDIKDADILIRGYPTINLRIPLDSIYSKTSNLLKFKEQVFKTDSLVIEHVIEFAGCYKNYSIFACSRISEKEPELKIIAFDADQNEERKISIGSEPEIGKTYPEVFSYRVYKQFLYVMVDFQGKIAIKRFDLNKLIFQKN